MLNKLSFIFWCHWRLNSNFLPYSFGDVNIKGEKVTLFNWIGTFTRFILKYSRTGFKDFRRFFRVTEGSVWTPLQLAMLFLLFLLNPIWILNPILGGLYWFCNDISKTFFWILWNRRIMNVIAGRRRTVMETCRY